MTTTVPQVVDALRDTVAGESLETTLARIDLTTLPAENLAEVALALRHEIERRTSLFSELVEPLQSALDVATARLIGEIRAAGGTALPHSRLDVTLVQRAEREKRMDVLRRLGGLLAPDELRAAIAPDHLDGCAKLSGETLARAIDEGAQLVEKVDLRKLDALARRYGGEIAAVIAEATPRTPIGAPKLVIEPRSGALSDVTPPSAVQP